MEKTKKYNLRSASSDTQMQTQLGGDMEFVTQLLGAGPSTSSQQGCDSQSSDSESNCSDVINASDSDDTAAGTGLLANFPQKSWVRQILMLWTHKQLSTSKFWHN